jgi:amino acid adenylation domain-containing protein/non-ribosomal peptide synthase protein (TIGR01720 family)/FkbM family methyltransferase
MNRSIEYIIAELKKLAVVPKLVGQELKLVGRTDDLSEDLLTRVRNSKQELITFIKSSLDKLSFEPIQSIRDQESYPLSQAQRRIWILSALGDDFTAYNIQTSFHIHGDVDLDDLNKALQACIVRHESLRTIFVEKDGEIRQMIQKNLTDCRIEYEDLRCCSDLSLRLKDEIKNLNKWKFTLDQGPLLKTKLFHLAAKEYALCLSMHHIIGDGTSVVVLLRDLLKFYATFRNKEIYAHHPLNIQYKDYSQWLDEKWNAVQGLKAHQFWENQFKDEPEPLILPTDFSRPKVQTFDGAFSRAYFDDPLQNDINAFCKGRRITIFNFLRTALVILLYKLSGQNKITIGTPMSGRTHPDLDDQIGLYVNTLPMTITVDATDSVLELLKRITQNTTEVFAYQDYPFNKILEHLNPKRDISRNPLFDVMMIMQNAAMSHAFADIGMRNDLILSDLTHYLTDPSFNEQENESSKFDLTFLFGYDLANRFYLHVEYATKIFSKATIARFIRMYLRIVSDMLDKPDDRISAVQIIDPEERQKILQDFNHPSNAFSEKSVVDIFEETVTKMPGKIALVFGNSFFSYSEINNRANQFANYLNSLHDIKADDLIALNLDRSPRMIVAILGILKSGGAYVPIDPTFPELRRSYIIQDSGCKLVIDDRVMSDFEGNSDSFSIEKPDVAVRPDSLVYVIYTSGSTGKPKGVMIEHRNVTSFFQNLDGNFFALPDLTFGSITSYTFDISVLELLGTLVSGVKQVLLAEKDPFHVLNEIIAQGINALQITPSRLSQLLDADGLNILRKLKLLLIGGESLGLNNYERLKEFTGTKVLHVYGPTETTIWSSCLELNEGNSLSIGRPLLNEQLYITDDYNNLLPAGITGEICIAGQGVGRGYLNNPTLTGSKFLPNPFKEGSRLYRTGDLGRLRPDNTIEFLGRRDDQVKIQGYRVELHEIEATLRQLDNVNDAVVLSLDNPIGEKEIVAYVMGRGILNPLALRKDLSDRLPAYMIPSHYIVLDHFPLNSSGKIDKKALPAVGTILKPGKERVEPQGEIEEGLAQLWSEVLDLKSIEISTVDNFFDLGGHSLKATRLSSRVLKQFGFRLGIKEIFNTPVFKDQADKIRTAVHGSYREIIPIPDQDHYPVSNSQRQLWIVSQRESANAAYNMSGAFQIEGSLQLEALSQAFSQLITRHEILRTVFKQTERGEVRQYVLKTNELNFTIAFQDLQDVAEQNEKVEFLARQDLIKPFNLATGPLIRATIFKLSHTRWVLVYAMHHIISDGWSMNILIRELMHFYNAYFEPHALPLPSLRLQYKDYVTWQVKRLEEDGLEAHRAYWLKQFTPNFPILALPNDRIRPAIKTYHGMTAEKKLDQKASSRLKSLLQKEECTLFMGLLAVVNVLLYKYTNDTDIIIGSPVAGRDHVDLEDQIGYYVNILALRTQFHEDHNFLSLLKNVKKTTLDAYAHQTYPFENLIEALGIPGDLSRNPLFDVALTVEDNVFDQAELGQFKDLRIVGDESITAQFSRSELLFLFSNVQDDIRMKVEYNSDLYSNAFIEQILTHFQTVLDALLREPEKPFGKLKFLTEEEHHQLVNTFNNTVHSFGSETIVDLFRQQAVTNPEKVAVYFEGTSLTYKDLNERSNHLASYLKRHFHVVSGEKIGLMLDRSENFIIAVLAVLKSGAAYVPVDPVYPRARKEFIFKDAQIELLITQTGYLFDIDYFTKKIFAIDVELDMIDVSTQYIPAYIDPTSLAYVIYTSGSTGHPKGVMIEHSSIANTIQSQCIIFNAQENFRSLQFASTSFDASVSEIFVALISGGSLYIIADETKKDPSRLAAYLAGNRIDIATIPPAYLQLIDMKSFHGLKTLITAGEPAIKDRVLAFTPFGDYCNAYGPTESSICATAFKIKRGHTMDNFSSVPIGRPIANTEIYVLNKHNDLVPIGVVGEICIGGTGLARGYINMLGLTNERFVPNPFKSGQKIYKSGDLGRWLHDGNLEFLGRGDEQVKINGYRIELSEIENTLLKENIVREAVAAAVKHEDGKYLVLYYTLSKDRFFSLNKTKEFSSVHGNSGRYELENGLAVFGCKKTEVEYLYREVFADNIYLRHGITIPDHGCVVDVGANVGIFSLFAATAAKDIKVYSLEPIPASFEYLKLNTSLYSGDFNVFNIGLSNKEETAVFTYFPNSSALSTRYSNRNDLRQTVKKFIHNSKLINHPEITDGQLDHLVDVQLHSELVECQLTTLSQFIRRNNISTIDLLKIDVENAERDVIEGIGDTDWPIIKQIVVEVHDVDGRLAEIEQLLTLHGFRVITEQQADLLATGLYNVYAIAEDDERLPLDIDRSPGKSVSYSSHALEDQMKEILAARLPAYMVPHHFVALESFPLTVNGKVDKKALPLPSAFWGEKGVSPVGARNEIEIHLIGVYEEVLKKPGLGIHADFFVLGGDSIKSIQVVSRLRQRGYSLVIQDVLLHPVIEELAHFVKPIKRVVDQATVEGPISLSPIQQHFFQRHGGQGHYNQSVLLYSSEPISAHALGQSLDKLVLHHDALRMSYHQHDQGWQQYNQGASCKGYSLEVITLSAASMLDEHCDRIQAGISLSGPLFHIGLFDSPSGYYLFLVCHHLVMDGVSWRILFEDLTTLYKGYSSGALMELPAKTDSFLYWQQKQAGYAQSQPLLAEIPYWKAIDGAWVEPLPMDDSQGSNLVCDSSSVTFSLDQQITSRLLTGCYGSYHTEINDILLTALVVSLRQELEIDQVLLALEGHGRENIGEDIDISRTIGWFTSWYPVLIDARYSNDKIRQLIEVKEQLHRVPNKGIGYGILRYLVGQGLKAQPEISFNYLGDFGTGVSPGEASVFKFSNDYQGRMLSGALSREVVLDVSGMIVSGRLRIAVSYSSKQYKKETIQRLAGSYESSLIEMIGVLSGAQHRRLTPVDLTYKSLSVEQVQELDQTYGVEDVYSLSPLQAGLYYHWMSNPSQEAYFVQTTSQLEGDLRIDLLEQSYSRLIADTGVLRTFFTQNYGVLLQAVKRAGDYDFRYEDVRKVDNYDLSSFQEADRRRGLDLHKDNLMRLTVIRVDDNRYEFIWSHHHILMDGWCGSILIRNFFEIYYSLLKGVPLVQKKTYPYADYITWLEKLDQGKSLAYWRTYLSGYDTLATVGRQDVNHTDYVGGKRKFCLHRSEVDTLSALCGRLGVTENTFIQTAWGILLSRYNGSSDVVFGAVVSGRPADLEGVEGMIGLFSNTIPVRITVNDECKAEDLLRQVQADAIAGNPHHYVQLAEVQAQSHLGRNLFDHILVFENFPVQEVSMQSTEGKNAISILSSEVFDQTNYPFTLTLRPGKTLDIQFDYNSKLYEETYIDRLAGHFLNVLKAILKDPSGYVHQINCLTEHETNTLLHTFNNAAHGFPREETLLSLFERQVMHTPEKTAVVFEDNILTYQTLNELSNQLGDYLRVEHKVVRNDLVCVQLERSEWMIVALLGILKSGAAYVPIDPAYPAERIDYMVDDSQCRLVLDQAELDRFKQRISSYGKTNPQPVNSPDDTAYVIYTSGTTGHPKGVLISHSNVVRLLKNDSPLFEFTDQDVWTMFHSYCFDFSVWEMYGALLLGGKLVVIPSLVAQDPSLYLDVLKKERVTVLNQTPSSFYALTKSELQHSSSALGLRYIIFGGEALSPVKLREWKEKYPSTRLINMYGITETTVHVTYKEITSTDIQSNSASIGTPIPTLSCYVLDSRQRLLPVGVPGELYVGGAGVSRGYLNKPALTTQRFIANPFQPSERLYRSGDKVRILTNGDMEYLGRIDDQVKIRGYRIELGEVETALHHYAGVESCLVMVKPDKDGNNQLIAYIVGHHTLNSTAIRAYLGSKVPSHMIPNHYVQIDGFKLTSNGKIDRTVLPDPLTFGMQSGVAYVGPRNETEEKLVLLWSDVLGIEAERIGVWDNFFDLGGHSLNTIQMIARINGVFKIQLHMQNLFNAMTIQELAVQIDFIVDQNSKKLSRKDFVQIDISIEQ